MKTLLLYLAIFALALQASVGHVAALKGDAIIERDGKKLSVKIGSAIEEKDTVRTQTGSRAQLLFTDETVINLGPNTDLKVDEFVYHEQAGNPKATFSVAKGAFKAMTGQVGKIAPGNFALKTRTSTIGIRGTHFQGLLGESEKFACTKGAISVTTPDGSSVVLTAGQMTEVVPGQAPAQPKRFVPSEMEQEEEQAQEEQAQEGNGEAQAMEAEETTEEEGETVLNQLLASGDANRLLSSAADLLAGVLEQESAKRTLESLIQTGGFEISMGWDVVDIGNGYTYSIGSSYTGSVRTDLSEPDSDATDGGIFLYSFSNSDGCSQMLASTTCTKTLVAADDKNEFKINVSHSSTAAGLDTLAGSFSAYFAYQGVKTQASQLPTDTVLTWNLLADGSTTINHTNNSEVSSDFNIYAGESAYEAAPLIAANTHNHQVMVIHADGVCFGGYTTASDGSIVISATDYNTYDSYYPKPPLSFVGEVYGSDAQGIGVHGQNDYTSNGDDYTETWAGAGYAADVDGLTGTVAQTTGSFILSGYIVDPYGTGTITASIDRETGTVSATVEGELNFDFGGNNAAQTAAYITDGFFGAIQSTSGESGYIYALPWGGSSDYVSWGYWAATGYAGSNMDSGVWVAGKQETAASYIDGLGNTEYTYNGHVIGSTTYGDIKMDGNNEVALTFDFSGGSVDGHINFDASDGSAWRVNVFESDAAVFENGFTAYGLSPGTGHSGGTSISGTVIGTFYGNQAQAVGGTFQISDMTNGDATGVFKANR